MKKKDNLTTNFKTNIMSKYTNEQKILHCRNEIKKNNKKISEIAKANVRLFNSICIMLDKLPESQKKRYDKELSSDGWKNTEYYKRNIKRYNN